MKSKILKIVKLATVSLVAIGFALAFSVRWPDYKGSGIPSWMHDGRNHLVRFLNPDGSTKRVVEFIGANEAWAVPGGTAAGAPGMPMPDKITGQATISAGSGEVTVPAAGYSPAIYNKCFAAIANQATPVLGNVPVCFVTSTATVIASATVTVGAVQIYTASTPATSPIVNWMLSQ